MSLYPIPQSKQAKILILAELGHQSHNQQGWVACPRLLPTARVPVLEPSGPRDTET